VQKLAADPAGPEPLRTLRTASGRDPAQTGEPRRNIATTTRAIVALCLVIVLAMWAVTFVSLGSERQSLIDHSRSEARNLASAFAADAGEVLDRIAASMAMVADHMRSTAGDADTHALLARMPLLRDGTIEGWIVGPDGERWGKLDPDTIYLVLRDGRYVPVPSLTQKWKSKFRGT